MGLASGPEAQRGFRVRDGPALHQIPTNIALRGAVVFNQESVLRQVTTVHVDEPEPMTEGTIAFLRKDFADWGWCQ